MKWSALLLIVVLLAHYIYILDMKLVYDSILAMGTGFYLIILISLGAYFMATLGWVNCFKNKVIPLQKLFEVRLIGEMLSLVNPTSIIAGDGFKYYLLKLENSDRTDLTNSILLSRVLTIFSFIVLAIISTAVVYSYLNLSNGLLISTFSVFMLAFVGLILYGLFSPKLVISTFFNKMGLRKIKWISATKFLIQLKKINISSALLYRHNKKSLIRSFFYFLSHWLFGALEIYVVLIQMGVEIHYVDALFVECGVVVIKSLLAFIPGQLGVEELSNKVVLGLFSTANPAVWLVLSIVRRLRFLFWLLIAVGLYVCKYNTITETSLNNAIVQHK